MAIFFGREVQAAVSVSGGGLRYQLIQWHPVHEVLAVAAKNETTDSDGSIHFYNEEVNLLLLLQCSAIANDATIVMSILIAMVTSLY